MTYGKGVKNFFKLLFNPGKLGDIGPIEESIREADRDMRDLQRKITWYRRAWRRRDIKYDSETGELLTEKTAQEYIDNLLNEISKLKYFKQDQQREIDYIINYGYD